MYTYVSMTDKILFRPNGIEAAIFKLNQTIEQCINTNNINHLKELIKFNNDELLNKWIDEKQLWDIEFIPYFANVYICTDIPLYKITLFDEKYNDIKIALIKFINNVIFYLSVIQINTPRDYNSFIKTFLSMKEYFLHHNNGINFNIIENSIAEKLAISDSISFELSEKTCLVQFYQVNNMDFILNFGNLTLIDNIFINMTDVLKNIEYFYRRKSYDATDKIDFKPVYN